MAVACLVAPAQVMAPLMSLLVEAAGVVPMDDDSRDGAAAAPSAHGAAGPSSSSMDADTAAVEGALPSAAAASRAAVNGAANWELVTVAVFSCARSCGGAHSATGGPPGGGGAAGCSCSWLEEGVAVINEDECHVRMAP